MVGMGPEAEARLAAYTQMARRSGATALQIRYSDDRQPTVWMAVAELHPTIIEGRKIAGRGEARFVVGAGLEPVAALYRLLEDMVDGSFCVHCSRPTGITDDFEPDMPLEDRICWYRWDPELATIRRGCE